MKRKEGFYWVKCRGEWIVAYHYHYEYSGKKTHYLWGIVQEDASFKDEDFEEIDEKQIVREAEEPTETKPILIGHLNKCFGFKGFEKIEAGTPVYELPDCYYFEMKEIASGKIHIQKYYKATLKPCINFISKVQ